MDIFEINKNLQNEFARKKIAAEWTATNNLLAVKKNKSFVKLDALEKEIILDLARQETAEKPDKKLIASLGETLKKTKAQKNLLLKKMGLTERDLKPKYACEKCEDSGFVGGKPCECFLKRRNEELIKSCGIKPNELSDFSDFREDIFSDERQKKKTNELKTWLQNWCKGFPAVSKILITLIGETGTGKTFLSKCVAKNIIQKGASVCFVSAFEMNNMFLKYHTTFDASKSSVLVPLIASDLLIIDDLGTEPLINNVTVNYLFLVLSERERLSKPVIITTNLKEKSLQQHYDDRIYSRLSNKKCGILFKIDGDDLRRNN